MKSVVPGSATCLDLATRAGPTQQAGSEVPVGRDVLRQEPSTRSLPPNPGSSLGFPHPCTFQNRPWLPGPAPNPSPQRSSLALSDTAAPHRFTGSQLQRWEPHPPAAPHLQVTLSIAQSP